MTSDQPLTKLPSAFSSSRALCEEALREEYARPWHLDERECVLWPCLLPEQDGGPVCHGRMGTSLGKHRGPHTRQDESASCSHHQGKVLASKILSGPFVTSSLSAFSTLSSSPMDRNGPSHLFKKYDWLWLCCYYLCLCYAVWDKENVLAYWAATR